jgi:hypothetical protein
LPLAPILVSSVDMSRQTAILLSLVVGLGACSGVEDIDADSDKGDAVGSPQVELRFAAFIQCPVVAAPPVPYPYYHGDGRGFDYDATVKASRVWVELTATPAGIRWMQKGVGETRAFTSDQIATSGTGACPYSTIGEPKPADRKTASDEEIGATAVWQGKTLDTGTLTITLDASASNPIAIGAPAADAIIDVVVEFVNGAPTTYRVKGDHDGFPAYELYLGRTLVYSHDSNALAQTPLSLFPPMEFPVNVGPLPMPSPR